MRTRVIKISDILDSRRMDVAYFINGDIGARELLPLSKYVDIKGGKRIPKGESFTSEKTDFLYLRLSDVNDVENIDYDALKCISEDLFYRLKRYEIVNNQIVFSIAGTIGKVFVVKNIPKEKRVVLTENCAMLQPKNDKILSEYISILLNCGFVQKQIEQNRIQTTIPKIGLDRIAKLKVPEIPSVGKQQEIVEIYSNAQKARSNKIQEANKLLGSIDDYLIETLRISKVKPSKKRYFTQKVSFLIGDRFDVQYHAGIKSVLEIIKTMPYKALGEIAVFSSEGWDQKSLFVDAFPYIEISAIDTLSGKIKSIEYIPVKEAPSRAKKIVRKGDILVSTTRPNRGAISIYDRDDVSIASTGFSIIRETDECILKEYLYIVLRMSLSLEQMAIRSSGGNYPAIIESELKKVIIPVPWLNVQKNIIETVFTIKHKADQLQKEGDALLEEAKQKVEKMIIG